MTTPQRMKRWLKLCVLATARSTGLFYVTRWLTRDSCIIIGWHGVSMGDEYVRFPQYFIRPSTLRNRLKYLNRHYTIVPLDTLVRQHENGEIEPYQVALTFDDGMHDLKPAALPELHRAAAPATIYVVSDTQQHASCMALSLLVRDVFLTSIVAELVGDQLPGTQRRSWHSIEERHATASECLRYIRGLGTYQEQCVAAKQIVSRLGMDWDALESSRTWSYLNPQELAELVSQGIDVQLHSDSHDTVAEMGERLKEDTERCRTLLESQVARETRDYCYPSGVWGEWCWPILQSAGVRSAVTCKLGPNFKQTPRLALRRYLDEEANSQLEFEALVSNFLWLLHVVRHPTRWYSATEEPVEGTSLY